MHIDTHKLTDAGIERQAAEDVGEVFTSSLATKQDFGDTRRALAEFKADLFRHLWLMAAGIVGLTVTLLKILP